MEKENLQSITEYRTSYTVYELETDAHPSYILQNIFEDFFSRLQNQPEAAQAPDQYGFRPRIWIDDALGMAQTVISGSAGYGISFWRASLGLNKGFNRFEHSALDNVLRNQGVVPT